MRFISTEIAWTEAMKDFAIETLTKNLRRTTVTIEDCEIKLSYVNKKIKSFKVEISGAGYKVQTVGKDVYATLVMTASKFKQIILKHHKKTIDKKRKNHINENSNSDVVEELFSKEKVFILTPMTAEGAKDKFIQTDYQFYVFKDIDCGNIVSIIYKRIDGTLGIIRCN